MTQDRSKLIEVENRRGERGAALITVLFISVLILALASALILTTSMSTTNAVSATDEVQAYYAAEAGLQAALNVLRGNVAPTINFKTAVANPQLAQWITRNYPSTTPDRTTLGPNLDTGMAYKILDVRDPDSSTKVVYSVSGSFTVSGNTSASASFGGGVFLTYTPQASTDITTTNTPALGTFTFSGVKPSITDITIPAGSTFTLQLTQTAPLALGSTSPISVSIKGTLSGRIYLAAPTVTLTFVNSSLEIPNVGTLFTVPTLTIPVDGTVTTAPTVVTTPEPRRLIVKVEGYGPHGARKNLQAMVSRFGANYDPPATFVLRGHDDSTTPATVSIGSSAKFVYSGNDNANGQPLPAFLVTNNPDYTALSNLKDNNDLPLAGDSSGLIPVLKALTLPADLPQLPSWLQTTSDPVSGARTFVEQLRQTAQQQFYKCSDDDHRDASCDRYFNTRAGGAAPTDYGAELDAPAKGLLTFVDGDATLPSEGGKGLLVVTGTLNVSGSKTFDGLVLVLGDGVMNRTGGGSATNFGAFVLARFGTTGGFLNPSFISSGSGTSGLQLDRDSIKNALRLGGVYVMAVSEY